MLWSVFSYRVVRPRKLSYSTPQIFNLNKMTEPAQDGWDYIVVGGGAAGCVITHRLLQYRPSARILVVEAGPDVRKREDIASYAATSFGDAYDWNYKSVPQPGMGGRQIAMLSGCVLGGGSVINSCEFPCLDLEYPWRGATRFFF